jgi:hypothetical protein
MAILFGIVVGLALGLTGGSGSIFAVPLLIYGLGLRPADAILISLFTVAVISAVGAAGALRSRLVEFRTTLMFAAGGMLAAPAGISLAQRVNESTITFAFALLMIIVAVSMWVQAKRHPENTTIVRADIVPAIANDNNPVCRLRSDGTLRLTAPCSAVLLLTGAVTGTLSGFFGVGGGFIIVPALIFVTRMSIHCAVATSLLIITFIGLAGAATALVSGRDLPWKLSILFLLGGVIGMSGGRLLARRIAGPSLQKIFAVVMIIVAVVVLVRG